jgi:hypothetical protein
MTHVAGNMPFETLLEGWGDYSMRPELLADRKPDEQEREQIGHYVQSKLKGKEEVMADKVPSSRNASIQLYA